MLTKHLHDAGLHSSHMQMLSMGSIGLCIGLWIRAKTVDQDERATPNDARCSSVSGPPSG